MNNFRADPRFAGIKPFEKKCGFHLQRCMVRSKNGLIQPYSRIG